jgi:hypothetical protein
MRFSRDDHTCTHEACEGSKETPQHGYLQSVRACLLVEREAGNNCERIVEHTTLKQAICLFASFLTPFTSMMHCVRPIAHMLLMRASIEVRTLHMVLLSVVRLQLCHVRRPHSVLGWK